MSKRSSFLVRVFHVSMLAVAAAGLLEAQTQGSCNFTMYHPKGQPYSELSTGAINNFGTVVGGLNASYTTYTIKAFVRYKDGSMSFFSVPKAIDTELLGRNKYGTSVGIYSFDFNKYSGLIYTSGSYATLNYPGSPSTELRGINKWNTIIGNEEYDSKTHARWGFKYQHGKFTLIRVPGSVQTVATGLNDNGTIVGIYQTGSAQTGNWSGFILKDGKFQTLKYPYLPGAINNLGVIVDIFNNIHYPNGKKILVYVDGSENTWISGINDQNVITGGTQSGSFSFQGFVATCQ